MWKFQADTDLCCILQEYFLIGDHDKSGRIVLFIINIICKHGQTIHRCRICTAHCRMTLILIFQDLLCRQCGICHTDLLPVTMLSQKM